MKTREVKLSCGKATMRGMLNKEMSILKLGVDSINEEYDKKDRSENRFNDDYEKAERITNLNNRVFSKCVVEHTLELNGRELHEVVAEFNSEDSEKFFKTVMDLTHIYTKKKKKSGST